MASPSSHDPIVFTVIGETLELAQILQDALIRVRPPDFRHVTFTVRDMAGTSMADVWMPLTGPVAIVYMTDDDGATTDPVMSYLLRVPAHHCYRVLPSTVDQTPAHTRTHTTSHLLADLARDAPLDNLWDTVRDVIRIMSMGIHVLNILIVTDVVPAARTMTETLRGILASRSGIVRVMDIDMLGAMQPVIDVCLGVRPGQPTRRTDTGLLMALVGLQEDGNPTADANAWLDDNPSAYLYYYIPDGVQKVRGRPALAHIKPSTLANRDARYDLVWEPILEKARSRDPQDDPEGLHNLVA
jgi:hypothetical protein